MSEQPETAERATKTIRVGLVPVLVVIALVVGFGIWFAVSQSGGSAAPAAVESPNVAAPVESAPTAPEPSATPSPTVTTPPPTPEEAMASALGRGYELTLDGAPATPLTANRFAAAYNVDAGAAPFTCSTVKTSEGFIGIHPATNDAATGYSGVIYQGGC